MKDTRSGVNLAVGEESAGRPREVEPDEPFRILVIGDFSGREQTGRIAGRKPVLVDRDNLDEVMAAMHPRVTVAGEVVKFDELDDFDPDRLLGRMDVFRKLEEPAAEMTVAPSVRARPAGGGSLLDEIVEEAAGPREVTVDDAVDLAAFIRKVTAAHLVREDPREKAHKARKDALAGEALRQILHAPGFQKLEAAWRGLDFLVRRLDTGESLKVYVLDATLPELVGDLEGTAALLDRASAPWALVVGLYAFGRSKVEARVLHALGALSARAGAPFVAEALPPGESSEEWEAFRQSAEARWVGLMLPRFLLRLPYGRETSPIESFDFEEMPESQHEEYLWGHPGICFALLAGETFAEDGWDMRLGSRRQVTGLPLHVYREDGEEVLKPCAEALMTEKEAEFLMEEGVMPLASLKGQDSALLVRFQSAGKSLAALRGRWR